MGGALDWEARPTNSYLYDTKDLGRPKIRNRREERRADMPWREDDWVGQQKNKTAEFRRRRGGNNMMNVLSFIYFIYVFRLPSDNNNNVQIPRVYNMYGVCNMYVSIALAS